MRKSSLTPIFAALLAVACHDATNPVGAPDLARSEGGADGDYIVVFAPHVTDAPGLARQFVASHGGALRFTYTTAIKGFAATLPEGAPEALRNNPNVAYVEPDRPVRLFDTQNNPPSWGLDRVDQRDLPLDDSYTFNNDGSGTNVYIFDTGVRKSHNDFGDRVEYVPNGNNGDFVGDGHGSAEDCHGHGTHVAGTAAGSSFGVAKGSPIWAARVVDCGGGGQVSMAIAAVDWATANALRPAVVNMSLGYGDVQSLRDAVENSVAAGVNYSVAAGNGSFPLGTPQDACNQSPAGAPNANTVGATEIDDDEASFSNYGTCVDILAPGVSITSAWHTGDDATNTISGTSMSTPHVTGAIALYLTATPGASPAEVSQALKDNASRDKINLHSRSASNGTPNLLLYTAFIGGGGEPTNSPPTASFTLSCTDLSCDFDGSGSTDSDGSITSYAWDFGDGNASSGVAVSHTYTAGGTYTVTLTVTDDDGATDSDTQSVTVNDPASNNPPAASFTFSCTDLSCDFDGSGSTDGDGSIASYAWDFGDGNTSSGVAVSHTYTAGGTYTVTLTVTDDDGATDSDAQSVTASEPSTGDITLSVSGGRVQGNRVANLTWSGATSTNVDVYRNGSLIVTTANDGAYTDNQGRGPGGTFVYQVCEAGTSTCSNEASVSF